MSLLAAAILVAQSYFGGIPVDGIHCERMEGAVEHIHTHVQIFDHGKPVEIPAQIGIDQMGQCLYWLHTHTPDGIIHVESPVKRPFTLGQFFDIWGRPLSRTEAAAARGKLTITINGSPYKGDPRAIAIKDREEVVIQAGAPFGKAHNYDWSKL